MGSGQVVPGADAERLLGAVADELLGGRAGAVPGGAPLPADRFGGLLALARNERATGVLAGAVRAGPLPVTDEQFAAVAGAHQVAMGVTLMLEQLLVRTSTTLTANGVDHVVLKGAAVAHLAYRTPEVRDFGDVDLLVAPGLMPLAVRVLVAGGARRQAAELAPGWDRDFAKSVTLTDRSTYEVDLHRTIAPGVFGLRIDPGRLFERTQRFCVGGLELRALAPEGQLLQACLHTAAGNRRVWLSSLCDIVALTRSGTVDLDRFDALVDDWSVGAVVERAVAIVAERLGGADVSVLAAGRRVSSLDRRRLARYSSGAGFSGPARTGFTAVPVRRWPAYARALVWPSAANLTDRKLTRAQHLRRLRSHL